VEKTNNGQPNQPIIKTIDLASRTL